MLQLFDTHAHLADPIFASDRGEVIERAEKAGVVSIVCVAETLGDARRALQLAEKYPQLYPCAGLFPDVLQMQQAEELLKFIRLHRGKLAAIGEVGLDRWVVKNESDRELQSRIFSRFIQAAVEFDLPLNVHSRSAGRQVIEALVEGGARKVQLHAFDGKASTAQPAVEAGYFFSIPPSIVRSRQKQKLVRSLPLSSLLLESDSPVLGPEPGRRNEPASVAVSLEAVAEIKGLDKERVAAEIAENTRMLYPFVGR